MMFGSYHRRSQSRAVSAGDCNQICQGIGDLERFSNCVRTDSRAERQRAARQEPRSLSRAAFPLDRREVGFAKYAAMGLAGYPRGLAKTGNLVFQAPTPWSTSTNSMDEPLRRKYNRTRDSPSRGRDGRAAYRGTRSREESRRRDFCDTGIGLRRSYASRTPLKPSTPQPEPEAPKEGEKDQKPILQRNEKLPSAVVALESNLHFRAYMEDGHKIKDRLHVSKDQHWSMYAVYDGHGGRLVTDKCLAILHDLVLTELQSLPEFPKPSSENVRRAMEKSFAAMDESLKMKDAWHCGATCTVTLIHSDRNVGKTLYVANVGDSRCVLVSSDKVTRTTVDHRANDPEEMFRVQSEGGIISRGRVGGQLMLTRALGDFALKNVGVSCMPYTSVHTLKCDDVVIIASDGLWDVLSDAEAARLCTATRHKHGNERIVARTLVEQSVNLGSTDNVTCVVVFT